MDECAARPTRKGRGCTGVAGFAVVAVGCHVAGERRRAHRARRALAGVGTVVAGVTPVGADRRMTHRAHRIGRKARRRVGVAGGALNSRHRDMRRRLHAGRGGAVVTA